MEYLKKFKNVTDANAQGQIGLISPHVDIIKDFNVVNYVKTDEKVFKATFSEEGKVEVQPEIIKYISFTSNIEQSVSFVPFMEGQSLISSANLEYSFDKTVWATWDYSALLFGSELYPTVYFRGNNPNGLNSLDLSQGGVLYSFRFSSSEASVDIDGNIMALINYENPPLVIPNSYCFAVLFSLNNAIKSISYNFIPSTSLTEYCYYFMFTECPSLVKAPYLPASILENGCYAQMFYNDSSLNEIHCDATNISAENCTFEWVGNISSDGTFYGKEIANWTDGSEGIPTGWTKVLS